MNFTIPSADLRRMIDRLKPCRGVGPWVAKFECVGDALQLIATGDTVSADVMMACLTNDYGNGRHGGVTLPLADIDAWLGGVEGPVTVTQDDTVVTFTTDDASLPVPLAAPEHEPALPPAPTETLPLPEAVWPALARVSWATAHMGSEAPTFKHMLNISGGRVWASDTYKLACVELEEDRPEPVSFYPELGDIIRTMDLAETQVTMDEDRRLHLTDQHGRYVVPTYSGTIPGEEIVGGMLRMGEEGTKMATFNRKELIDALARLKPLMASDSSVVGLTFEFGQCVLTVTTGDNQTASRDVECGPGAEGTVIAFTLSTLRNAMASLHEDEAVLRMGTDRSPALLREGDYTALLMPIKGGAPARARDRASKQPRF